MVVVVVVGESKKLILQVDLGTCIRIHGAFGVHITETFTPVTASYFTLDVSEFN